MSPEQQTDCVLQQLLEYPAENLPLEVEDALAPESLETPLQYHRHGLLCAGPNRPLSSCDGQSVNVKLFVESKDTDYGNSQRVHLYFDTLSVHTPQNFS